MTRSIFYNPYQIVKITIVLFTVKTTTELIAKCQKSVCTLRNEMPKVSLALHGSRSPGLEMHADEEPPVPPGYSPKIVLHRVPITDANTVASSPARVSTTASQPPADHQVHALIYDKIIVLSL